MSDEEATLIVTAGTAMYGLDVMGGLIAGEGVVVTGPGPIGLMGVAVAKALGAAAGDPDRHARQPAGDGHASSAPTQSSTSATRTRSRRCGASPAARACSMCWNAPARPMRSTRRRSMVNRGGRICLAAFPHEPVPVDLAYIVRNNIYVFGIRGEGKSATHRAAALMAQKRFDAKMIHTHTFPLARGADRDPLRPRAHRRRDQGGGEDALSGRPPGAPRESPGDHQGLPGGARRNAGGTK